MLLYKVCFWLTELMLNMSSSAIIFIIVIILGLGLIFGKEIRTGLFGLILTPAFIRILGEIANFCVESGLGLFGYLIFIAMDACIVTLVVIIVRLILDK